MCLRAYVLGAFIWSNAVEIEQLIPPLTYQFLSVRYTKVISSVCSCLWSTKLLYIAEFRRKPCISPVIMTYISSS
ncbi:hypothetical protein BDW62DRAFT_180174 [Aspergillus aurantiobrunneus]